MTSHTSRSPYAAPRPVSLRIVATLACVALATSCAGDYEGEETLAIDSLSQAISGGTPVTSQENNGLPFNAAVLFSFSGGCSGVKIADKRFLTAAHCVTGSSNTVRISNGTGSAQGTQFNIASGTLFRHPSWLLGTQVGETLGQPGLYDVAVFNIQDPNNLTGSILTSPVSPLVTSPGTTNLTLVAYGCDLVSGNVGKQKAAFDAASNSNQREHVHYITETIAARNGCSGDSGGPLFRGTTSPRVTGIDSYDVIGANKTAFTRLFNIQEWIAAPALNSFSHNSTGFFMNGAVTGSAFPPLRCASIIGTGAVDNSDVRLQECDGVDALITGNPPGWRLMGTGGAQLDQPPFAIVNRTAGTCLGVSGASTSDDADVRAFTCNVVQRNLIPAHMRWTFSSPLGNYVTITNQNSGKCLGTSSDTGALNGDVRQFNCGTSSKLKWAFTR